MGGSAAGVAKHGLTEEGRRMVREMESRRMIVDLAHASEATIDDVLALATRPVLVSHTGVRGTCDNPRNLSDQHLQAIADGGGLIGIGFFEIAICGSTEAIAAAIVHTKNLVGVDHVALGSDFDGAVHTPFDAAGMPHLTDALLRAGLTDEEVRKIMGENTIRFLLDNLP